MKNNIATALAALAVFAGAFFMPGKALAQDREDTTPPTLHTELSDGTLHIEADDSGCGVDAVYVQGRRINYRVDGAVDVPLEDYAGTMEETLEVYAIDFAGNQSETVEVANPYFESAPDAHGMSASASADSEAEADAGGAQELVAFTPDGHATVTDNATDADGKEFYTFATPQGNVFYLVIDGQRDSDNVYFFNAVTEKDLYALAEKDAEAEPDMPGSVQEETACICTDRCEAGSVDASCAACFHDIGTCTGKEAEPEEEKERTDSGAKGSGMDVFLLFAAAAAAAGWYLKIYRPKRELDNAEDIDDLLDDGPEVNEDDMEEKARISLGADIYGQDINEDAAAYDDYPDNGPYGEGAGGDME